MTNFEARFGHWVLAGRWWIIVVTLALVAWSGAGARFLTFTTDYRIFFSPDNPERKAFETLEAVYAKNDGIMFVLAPADGDVFTAETLDAVETLTDRAWQIPYSSRVDSLSNFQHTYGEDDDLIVEDLVQDAASLDEAARTRIRDIALAEPLLLKRLVSDKGHVTGVNVTLQLPGIKPTEEVPETVAFARGLADELRTAYPDIEVRLAGVAMLNNAFNEASAQDLKTLVPLSFVVMLISLGLMLRGLTGTAATLLVIVFSIVVALGLGGYAGTALSPPSATAPTVILTVAIANSVHVLVTFLHAMRHGSPKRDALVESLRVNLQPVFLTSLTTAFGFLSMNFSEVPPFRHLGNLVAVGVAVSFVLAVTFLPALMSLLPVRARISERADDAAMARLGDFVVRRRSPLLWGMAGLILALLVFIPRNELNDIFVHYFDESVAFRQATDFTTDNLTGMMPLEYDLKSNEPGGISNPAFQRELEAFADWLRQQPEIIHVNTVSDTLKRLNRSLHGDDADYYRLPEDRDLAAQYLLLYEMSLPYGLDLNNQLNVDKSATRLVASAGILSSNEVLALDTRARDWIDANAPHIRTAGGTGPALMFAHIGQRNIVSMLFGTTVALVLISLVLVFAFRSLKIGLISMVPNLVPAAMGFGLWGLFVGQVGLALSVVTGMTLGIVVDDTVHFLSKYLRARREQGFTPQDAVRYAFSSVGRALLVTSIVLIAGFLVLAMSSFELNAGMGLLTAIVIAFALTADFLFLPPLLMKLEDKNYAKVSATVAAADAVPRAGIR